MASKLPKGNPFEDNSSDSLTPPLRDPDIPIRASIPSDAFTFQVPPPGHLPRRQEPPAHPSYPRPRFQHPAGSSSAAAWTSSYHWNHQEPPAVPRNLAVVAPLDYRAAILSRPGVPPRRPIGGDPPDVRSQGDRQLQEPPNISSILSPNDPVFHRATLSPPTHLDGRPIGGHLPISRQRNRQESFMANSNCVVNPRALDEGNRSFPVPHNQRPNRGHPPTAVATSSSVVPYFPASGDHGCRGLDSIYSILADDSREKNVLRSTVSHREPIGGNNHASTSGSSRVGPVNSASGHGHRQETVDCSMEFKGVGCSLNAPSNTSLFGTHREPLGGNNHASTSGSSRVGPVNSASGHGHRQETVDRSMEFKGAGYSLNAPSNTSLFGTHREPIGGNNHASTSNSSRVGPVISASGHCYRQATADRSMEFKGAGCSHNAPSNPPLFGTHVPAAAANASFLRNAISASGHQRYEEPVGPLDINAVDWSYTGTSGIPLFRNYVPAATASALQVAPAPAEQPQAPAERPQVLAERPQALAEQPQAPAEQPPAPEEQPPAPAEQPQAPAEQPQAPAEQPQAPEEQPQAPEEQPQAPVADVQPEEPMVAGCPLSQFPTIKDAIAWTAERKRSRRSGTPHSKERPQGN